MLIRSNIVFSLIFDDGDMSFYYVYRYNEKDKKLYFIGIFVIFLDQREVFNIFGEFCSYLQFSTRDIKGILRLANKILNKKL